MPNVEIITNYCGDWTVIKVDNKIIASSHDTIPESVYTLLFVIGVTFKELRISDKEMEELY